jgi:ankyrin repeat protein
LDFLNFSFDRYEDIWNAINVNDTDKLEKLLRNKEWPTAALFDKDGGHTMLHTAASLGHVESLMVIIEHTGAKPDLLNANLATPLHFA